MKFEILSRAEARDIWLTDRHIWISINGTDEVANELPKNPLCQGVLPIFFDDVLEDKGYYSVDNKLKEWKVITPAQAEEIVNFATAKNDIDLIAVHCFAGICRSAAVAAALSLMFNGTDAWVFECSRFCPNRKVYREVLNAAHRLGKI